MRWDLVWVMALVVVLAEGLLSQAHGAASPQGLLAADRLDVIPSRSSVSYHVATLTDQYRVQHELRRRILERLRRESIAIRAPARVA